MVALAVRLAWAAALPADRQSFDRLPDQREYLSLGRGLLADHTLGLVDPRFGQTVRAYRTPGYPLLVAACGASVRFVRLAQAAIDTGTVLAIYLIARRLCGTGVWTVMARDVPLIAAAVVAIDPFSVYFCGLVLTETAFTALLAWAVYLLVRGKPWPAALLLVAAAYVRPTALLVAPAVAAAVGWANRDPVGAYAWKRPAQYLATVGGCLVVGLLPWAWRNDRVLGRPVWTATNAGVTLYDGFHAGATGASDQAFLARMPGLVPMTEVGRSDRLSDAAWRWAVAHPADVAWLTVRKVARGWSPVPLSKEFGRPAYRWAGAAFAVPFDGLCVAGLWSRRLRWPAKLVLVAPAVAVTVTQVLSVGSIRYRIPAEAPLAVLAAVGAVHLTSQISDRRSRRA